MVHRWTTSRKRHWWRVSTLASPPLISTPYEPDSAVCAPSTQLLYVGAIGSGLQYHWVSSGDTVGTSHDTLAVGPLSAGTYVYHCLVNGSCGAMESGPITINVAATPELIISQQGGMLACTPGFSDYQWFLDGTPIPGASSPEWTPIENGVYSVSASNSECIGVSPPYDFVPMGNGELARSSVGIVYDPGTHEAQLTHVAPGALIELFDLNGKRLGSQRCKGVTTTVDLTGHAEGIYLVGTSGHLFRVVR